MAKDKPWILFLLAAILYASTLPAQERVVFPVAASTKTTGYTPLWAALNKGSSRSRGSMCSPS